MEPAGALTLLLYKKYLSTTLPSIYRDVEGHIVFTLMFKKYFWVSFNLFCKATTVIYCSLETFLKQILFTNEIEKFNVLI
jgi:hypothetical protein